jgi:dinuclear metal center YbgI/SA1388 family protein
MNRDDVVAHLDDYLRVQTIEDSSNNGLQVEGGDEVSRLAFAVDAGLAAFEGAKTAGAQMLIVHHGLFWGKPLLITGIHRRRLESLFEAGLSLYAVHLPLDFHDEVGNNATLAQWLGLADVTVFGDYKGQPSGVVGQLPEAVSLDEFVSFLERALGGPVVKVWPFGAPSVRRVGVVSGGGGSFADQAAAAGVDVYVTGEMNHNVYHQAKELGLNVVYGGHYATETAGLKALADHLGARFGLDTIFLDLPTGA